MGKLIRKNLFFLLYPIPTNSMLGVTLEELEDVSAGGGKTSNRSSGIRELIETAKSLIVLLVVALSLRATIVEAFKIPSASMERTLQIGDHILVNKFSYGLHLPFFQKEAVWQYDVPTRGDIIVFTLPDNPRTAEDESDTNLIKRVIGLPGDQIRVSGTNVYVNGTRYAEDDEYTSWLEKGLDPRTGEPREFGPVIVPPGKLFMMGDNRDRSKDSRFWDDPFLPVQRVKGRAFIIYWNAAMFHRMFRILH
jgi:signal peptidase I